MWVRLGTRAGLAEKNVLDSLLAGRWQQIAPRIAERLRQVCHWSVLFSKSGKMPRKSPAKPATPRRIPTSYLERYIAECCSAVAAGDVI